MKKLILLLLLIPVTCFGWGGNSAERFVEHPAGGTVDNCPAGTYDFAWTGDNTSGSTTACLANGASTVTVTTQDSVTVSGTYGHTGNGALIDAAGDDMCWTVDFITAVGTLYVYGYANVASTGEGSVASLVYNGTDHARIGLASGSLANLARYTETHAGGPAMSLQTWVRHAYSWDLSGTDKHSVVADGSNWATGEDVEALTAPAGNFSRICVGDLRGSTINRETWVDDIYYVSGTYEAADPKP